jgi:hypothetical protein
VLLLLQVICYVVANELVFWLSLMSIDLTVVDDQAKELVGVEKEAGSLATLFFMHNRIFPGKKALFLALSLPAHKSS